MSRDPIRDADQYRWWEKSDNYTWGDVAEVLIVWAVGVTLIAVAASLLARLVQ